MAQRIDLAGKKFGKLTALDPVERAAGSKKELVWRCVCECGEEAFVPSAALRRGKSRSCGCSSAAFTAEKLRTHGAYQSRSYKTWCTMKQRCLNPNNTHFYRYGGRGIRICQEWAESFERFLADMGERPEGATLDRIDNDRGYEPGNCRWASKRQQQNNTVRNRVVSAFGKELTVAEWCRETGISYDCLSTRIARGWSAERALTQPVQFRQDVAV